MDLGKYIFCIYTFAKIKTIKNLSLKLDDILFNEIEKITAKINKTRNRHIEAVQFYNLLQKSRIISRQLKKEPKIVQEESMKVPANLKNSRM